MERRRDREKEAEREREKERKIVKMETYMKIENERGRTDR